MQITPASKPSQWRVNTSHGRRSEGSGRQSESCDGFLKAEVGREEGGGEGEEGGRERGRKVGG